MISLKNPQKVQGKDLHYSINVMFMNLIRLINSILRSGA
jgi:hypothetical protein